MRKKGEFLLVVTLFLLCWPNQTFQARKLTAGTVVTAIVESGITLRKAVNNFTNTEVTPKINDLNQRIRALNLEAAGIPQEKIPEYKKSLEDFSNIRKALTNIRIVLINLARETIRRGDRLLRLMDLAEEKPAKAKKGLKIAAKQMMDLVTRSDKFLEEAEEYLKDVNKKLSKIDANLLTLKHKLEKNSSDVVSKINIASKHRRKRFAFITAALIATAVAGGAAAGVGITLAVTNKKKAELENLITEQQKQLKKLSDQHAEFLRNSQKRHADMMRQLQETQEREQKMLQQRKELEWSTQKRHADMMRQLQEAQEREQKMLQQRKELELAMLKAQKVVITTAVDSVNFFLSSLKESEGHITSEQKLIINWRSHLSELISMMDTDESMLDMIDFFPDEVRRMVKNLQGSCQNYIDKRIPKDYNDIVESP